jgi:hypothetical protein
MTLTDEETNRAIGAIHASHEWREVTTLREALAATEGKTIVKSIGWVWGRDGDETNVVLFFDGTGFAVEYESAMRGYSERTPGEPASVRYYALSPRTT